MHSAQELVARITALASLPTVYVRVREELDAPDGSIGELARIIATDPALTVRLLRVVNSALYGFAGRIDTVSRAVTVLGMQQVHDIVLASSVGTTFGNLRVPQLDMARFWRGCVLCGLAARELGRACRATNPERLFVIGLLADLGHLILFQTVPELAVQAQARADAGEQALDRAERELIGCDHAEVAATLMAHWRLPAPFAEIAGAQLNPRLAGTLAFEAGIVHLATHIVHADRYSEGSDVVAARTAPFVWSQLGLAPEQLSAIREEAELNLSGCIALIFPEPRPA